jgi:hypothetical protein
MECERLEWNPLASAVSHSAMAGVLAGLVFAGIVVLISDRWQVHGRPHRRALVLFAGALLPLAVVSFLFGVIAGEQVCPRAWTGTMLAAGLLGPGALGIFGGVCWLFNAYDDDRAQITRLATFMTYTVALVVGYQLQVNAADYLATMAGTGLSDVPSWLVRAVDWYAVGVAAIVLGVPVTRFLRSRVRSRASRVDRGRDRAAIQAAYLSVANVIVVAAGSGSLAGRPGSQWEPTTPTSVVVATTLLSLALPTVAVAAQLRALPGGSASQSTVPAPAGPAPAPPPRQGTAADRRAVTLL